MHARLQQLFLAGLLLLTAGVQASSAAQVGVTSADIQRLQDLIYDTSSDVSRLRSRDANLSERLETELDDLRDEVIYLKVKMRRERSVSRSEYTDVRDRIQSLRSRARTGTTVPRGTTGGVRDENDRGGDRYPATPSSTSPYPSTNAADPNTVPAGAELDVSLQQPLSSDTAQVEDRFEATTLVDVTNESGRILIPAGSVARGVVTSVDRASRTDRKGSLTVHFDQISIRNRSYPIRGTVTQALESEGIKGEAGRIGTGAGVGAVIGGILGGLKGAIAGILIGAGGTVAATEGKDVTLEPGTVLRVRLDTPVTVR